MKRFEACKTLRRQILRYIQLVESEQFLGSLIHANEELVDALMLFVKLDKPIEEDSDSEDGEDWNRSDDVAEGVGKMNLADRRGSTSSAAGNGRVVGAGAGAPPSKGKGPLPQRYHPRQQQPPESESEQDEDDEDDDPDNPFGDSNEVVDTPSFEW